LGGKPDQEIFEQAIIEERIVLTYNVKDYIKLAKQQTEKGLKHSGLLWVSCHSNRTKVVTNQQIIDNIAKIEKTYTTLQDQCLCVNGFR